jgi:hypothetical protein
MPNPSLEADPKGLAALVALVESVVIVASPRPLGAVQLER